MSTGRLAGKVAFITGAARGQGRSHAIRLAQEGADIIAVDICGQIESVPYPMGTSQDLAQTVEAVEALDRRIIATQADVRDYEAIRQALDDGIAQLGRLDIVSANAGVCTISPSVEMSGQSWRDVIDTNLTGAWQTAKAAIPHIIKGGRGGSIVITSSVGGLMPLANLSSYVASKHGVIGLMRTLALELAPHFIRVNTILPTQVATPMILNDASLRFFLPDSEQPTVEEFAQVSRGMIALPIPWVEPVDISNALLFLASDESRYVTGITLPVDGGMLLK
jgi:(+)-trans-carveol dehydrogenase